MSVGSPAESRPASPGRKVAQLFHTCLVNEIAPEAGLAAVRLLERIGYRVEVPLAQTCCGQPAYNGGFQADARAAARHTIAVLEATQGVIVVPSGSCGDMLIHQYPALFEGEPAWHARALAVAGRCRELSGLLAASIQDLTPLRHAPASVAYHPSCHLLRGLGERTAPLALLQAVEGLELRPVKDGEECCGFGGLFSIKSPDISGSMLGRKLDALCASGAERVVSCDLGCLMHLEGGLRRRGSDLRVQHLAELLDEARL